MSKSRLLTTSHRNVRDGSATGRLTTTRQRGRVYRHDLDQCAVSTMRVLKFKCGILYLRHRSTAISNWPSSTETEHMLLCLPAAALPTGGSRQKRANGLTCTRRTGANGCTMRLCAANAHRLSLADQPLDRLFCFVPCGSVLW